MADQGSGDAGESKQSAVATAALQSEAVLGYASVQMLVPWIRGIELKNPTEFPLADVEIRIEANPPVIEPWVYRLDFVRANERREIACERLRYNHQFLGELTESVRGHVRMTMTAKGADPFEVSRDFQALARDQWGGTQTVPELLATFIEPNSPEVDRILASAAELGQLAKPNFALIGYGEKTRESVLAQLAAIFAAVAKRGFKYSLPPAGFANTGQKIRSPERIASGGLATCLDLTLLVASALEQAGLNPLVLVNNDHAWLGLWLVNTAAPTSVIDDVQFLRKRIDAGELITVETTLLTHPGGHDLRAAQRSADALVRDGGPAFGFAVDVRRARLERVTPLPSAALTLAGDAPIAERDISAIHMPTLPPLVGNSLRLDEEAPAQTPRDRLDRWQSKLLDLTLNNRLLNFKPNRLTIPLIIPDVPALEDSFAEGHTWTFQGRPEMFRGADPRSRQLAIERDGVDPLVEHARGCQADRELLSELDAKATDTHLYNLYLEVRRIQEESGVYPLFLTLGQLHWREDDRSERTLMAPLVLIPVQLDRGSVRSKFKLKLRDGDALVNPTLVHALKLRHGITVQGIDPPPTDEHGLDLGAIWGAFYQAVKDIPNWEVKKDVYLGIFSFHKHVMYTDLTQRREALMQSPIVKHLIERPDSPLGDRDITRIPDLDADVAPGELLCPRPADSSQMNALLRAQQGHSFVLRGPPGTGKSETIVNLIADALGHGKRVLFVSEKMTALEVVEKRLTDVGLGPFCLQLHSAKADKQAVLGQLQSSLLLARSVEPAEWKAKVEQVASLRQSLNQLVQALHRPHPSGLTVRSAIDTAVKTRQWPVTAPRTADASQLTREHLDKCRRMAGEAQVLAEELGPVGDRLAAIRVREWTSQWEDEWASAVQRAEQAGRVLTAGYPSLDAQLSLPGGAGALDSEGLAGLTQLSQRLLEARLVPPGVAAAAESRESREFLLRLAELLESRARAWQKVEGLFRPSVLTAPVADWHQQWSLAEAAWAGKKWWETRRIIKAASVHAHRPDEIARDSWPAALLDVKLVQDLDEQIKAVGGQGQLLLGEQWKEADTSSANVRSWVRWATQWNDALWRWRDLLGPEVFAPMEARLRMYAGAAQDWLAPGRQLLSALSGYITAHSGWIAATHQLGEACGNPELMSEVAPGPMPAASLLAVVPVWMSEKPRLRRWCRWNTLVASSEALGIGDILRAGLRGNAPVSRLQDYAEYCLQVAWLKAALDRDPVLRSFDGALHDHQIRRFAEIDAKFTELTRSLIVARLGAKAHPALRDGALSSELGLLSREIQKRSRHLSVRQMVGSMPGLLPVLKPCLMMSPLSVAQYLSTSSEVFDLVVFDEASQITAWDAAGVLGRARQAIIVGDNKQLPPSHFYEVGGSDGDDGSDTGAAEDLESILDECQAIGLPVLSLGWHYRSAHESLIAFSNARYYNNELITFPAAVTDVTAVKLVPVAGVYARGSSQTNEIEARAVVDRLVEHYAAVQEGDAVKTVGVVTFNANQRDLITSLFDAKLRGNPELEQKVRSHGLEELFIKNLETVQGDERDLILFSTTFGRDGTGRFLMNFGPLGKPGGERRLNVAVTRARRAVEVFSSMSAEDIDLGRSRAKGVADLKAYLAYAAHGPVSLARESSPTGRGIESPFEAEVRDVLVEAGWDVHTQVGCANFRIDLAVIDPDAPGRYLVGVECDGASYHGWATARDRDHLRQMVLERLGWSLVRVWSTDWWTDRTSARRRLLESISATQATRKLNAGPVQASK